MISQDIVKKVAELLKASKRPLFITGAGISADSGLPTYRGVAGLYNSGKTEEGIPIEEAISGTMLRKDPVLCWKYVDQLIKACSSGKPNSAHEFIAQVEREKPDTWVLTQNVDGFHTAAGSSNVIEMHGHIRSVRCKHCQVNLAYEEPHIYDSQNPKAPRCSFCYRILRPNVVLFDESLPQLALAAYAREMAVPFDIVFTIGTTSVFPYISQPVYDAGMNSIPTVEINPSSTTVSHYVSYKLECGAAEAFTAIEKYLCP